MRNKLVISSITVVTVNVVCLFLAGNTGTHYWYYAMFAIVATGLITFFGILIQNLEAEEDKNVSTQSMRLAITGLVTSSYIALQAYLLFIPENTQLAKVSETLLTNFTAVVGTVIAFFFGSTAYIEGRRSDRNGDG